MKYKHHLKPATILILASVVAILTVFSMILPGIAMERELCNLQEHKHTPECYREVYAQQPEVIQDIQNNQQSTSQIIGGTEDEKTQQNPEDTNVIVEKELICGLEEHIHTQECKIKKDENSSSDFSSNNSELKDNQDTQSSSVQQNDLDVSSDYKSDIELENSENQTNSINSTNTEKVDVKNEVVDETEDDKDLTPVDLNKYITKATLKYKEKNGAQDGWIVSKPGVIIPGNAKLQLEIEYKNVPIDNVMADNNSFTFNVPNIMRNPESKGDIINGSQIVGQVSVENNVLKIEFKRSWLEEIKAGGDANLHGEFYIESDINLSAVPGNGDSIEIVFGDLVLHPTFDTDVIAKHGQINISKKVSNHVIAEDKSHYLEYTLIVQSGEDSMPDVKVVDHFTNNGQYARYVNITPTPQTLTSNGSPKEEISNQSAHGQIYKANVPVNDNEIPTENNTNITEPGSIVWNIGTMQAHENRTLTYRVKLEESHHFLNEQPIQNKAVVFSKNYNRDQSVEDFKPKADLEMVKTHTEPVRDETDGTHKIRYTVKFTTPASNNHVLEDLKIKDSLNDSQHATNDKVLPYIEYDKNSFHLYHSKTPGQNEVEVNSANGNLPKLVYADDGKSFTLSMGDLERGESYSFQYDLKIKPAAFAAGNLENLLVKNRAVAFADNSNLPTEAYIQKSDDNVNIEYKNWIKKSLSSQLQSDTEISLGENVYDATGGSIVPDTNKQPHFKVSKGSYKYNIEINKLGDFDVTKAHIKDRLRVKSFFDNQKAEFKVQYSGYLQIDAFDTKQSGDDTLGKFVESRYVKIDGMNAFDIRLSDVGFTPNYYAYRLTYYVTAVNNENISQVGVVNSAIMNGTVGVDENEFEIGDFSSNVEVTMQGGHHFEVSKKAWYYEKEKDAVGKWENGSIFWGVKIDGTQLHKGKFIKDHVKQEWSNGNVGKLWFHDDSFIGMYIGKFNDGESFTDFSELQYLIENGYFTEVPSENYKVSYEVAPYTVDDNVYGGVIVEMLNTIDIPTDSSIYIILKGEPNELPHGNRKSKQFVNYVSTSDDGKAYVEQSNDTKYLYKNPNIFKEFLRYFEFDGQKLNNIDGYHGHDVPIELLKANGGNGHYISWAIKVNYGGDLAGKYQVIDDIPEGMELSFARMKWQGEAIRDRNIRMKQIPDYKNVLGQEWEEHSVTAGMDEVSGKYTSFYYTNGNKVLWEVDNLVAGHREDIYAVDFQVVARITDPQVLMGGLQKEFVNHAYLRNEYGVDIDFATNGQTVTIKNINKTKLQTGNTIEYTIELNPTGEDMLKGEETVTLIDEMSEALVLDMKSIKVYETKSQKDVEYKASYEDGVLSIDLPDSTPITIKYRTSIQATPNTTITLSNKAYWKGFSSDGGSDVIIKDFFYAVGGIAGGAKNPSVRILKYDKDNITQFLPGAYFLMEEGSMNGKEFVPNGKTWEGDTNENGILEFGKNKKKMKFNTVYRLTETKAPSGYTVSNKEYLFAIGTKDSIGQITYPDNVTVFYNSANYEIGIGNKKASISIIKQFENVDGTHSDLITGQYRFGLFDNANGEGTPIKEAVLDIQDNVNNNVVFDDLDTSKAYYVFELDNDGKPIKPNEFGNVGSNKFQVIYKRNENVSDSVYKNSVNDGDVITVTNRLTIANLPETGGKGSLPYIFMGTLLMIISVALFYSQRKYKSANKNQ